MLFRKHILSTRTLLQLAVTVGLLVGGVGAASAANSGNPPLLVPYTINVIAGDNQIPSGATGFNTGFAGEGGPAVSSPAKSGAVFSGATTMAVDSVGNVYITDTGNDLIREVNAQTGIIKTVGGKVPQGCSGLTCSLHYQGCADGVPAAGNAIGYSLDWLALDAYGNLYFDDSTTLTVSVIYRGGAQLAALIALEDPTGTAASGGSPQPGYVYRLAGTVDPASCKGTGGNKDQVLATSAQFGRPGPISIDSAGNIYVTDFVNNTTRVINAQSTPQTFFQTTIQPGYMAAVANCNAALTVACPTGVTTKTLYTGINGPVNQLTFNGGYQAAVSDAYGNLYQLDQKGANNPGIYGSAAYAGGAPLANLIEATAPFLAHNYCSGSTPGCPPLVPSSPGYGDAYDVLNDPNASGINTTLPGSYVDTYAALTSTFDIRPSMMRPDIFGTFWFEDNHYPELERIDQYTSLATNILHYRRQSQAGAAGHYNPITPINNALPTFSNPYYCVYGNTSSASLAWTKGPITYDSVGDGCPSTVAAQGGTVTSALDVLSDGVGNLYLPDTPNNLMREIYVDTNFPSTAVGTTTPVTQGIQVHFSSNNLPVLTGTTYPAAGVTQNSTTTSFSIQGSTDFTIDTTTPEFSMGSLISANLSSYSNSPSTQNFQMYAGVPTCMLDGVYPTQVTPSVSDWDCLVYVKFNPTAPGLRQAALKVTTANGSIYTFPLTGIGTGGQLAIDGGSPTVVPITGMKNPNSIAVDGAGNLYVADSGNNQVIVVPAGGGAQKTIGTGLSTPMGVAVDASNNVYISDTGNNRVLKVDPNTNIQTALGNNVWVPGPGGSVPQYTFKAPEGLAVDTSNNVYVADTGNKAVVEIPSNIALGGAAPLLSYANAPSFSNPVQVAVDSTGNVYIADTKSETSQVVELPPGGGDLINVPGRQFPNLRGNSLKTPSAVAVDAAGDVYIADEATKTVWEFPSGTGPGSAPAALNLPGLGDPTSLALDSNGNLYIADSSNDQVLFVNRQSPAVDFGTVPQALSNPTSITLTVTNIGTQPVALVSPFISVTSTNPSNNTAFTVTNNSCSGSSITPGLTCTLTATFNPTTDGPQGENLSVNGTSQSIELTANGEQPLANVALSASYSTGTTPTAGATATITATVTQPHLTGVIPAGTVTFTYAVDSNVPKAYASSYSSCGTGGTQTVTLVNGVATFNLPPLVQGLNYVINATYTPTDTLNSGASATPLNLQVPGVQTAATATSVSFTYGQAVPTITGTVSPAPASPTTAVFTTNATASTAIGTYPIQVYFTGGNNCAYGFPTVLTPSGQPAVVTEKAAPLSYAISDISTTYGAPPVSYGLLGVLTGAVNGDTFSATFSPANSQILNAGTYSLVPTVTGADIGNYIVTAPPSTLTVTQAQSTMTVVAAKTAVLNTPSDVASATYQVVVSSAVSGGIGIPTGTVTVTDNFTPITLTAPGTGTPAAPATEVLTLDPTGVATFTPNTFTSTNTVTGTHSYSFAYSGDVNFKCSLLGQAATSSCTSGGSATTTLLVDNPDFSVTTASGTIQIQPGVTPSGNGLPAASGQNTSIPESAIITLTPILGFSGQVSVSCTTPKPYISCSMTPTSTTISGTATATVLAVWTPQTLPLGYNTSQLHLSGSKTVLAFLPLGVLAFCVRRRRRLSRVLWMLIAFAAVGTAMQGCGGNQVSFYTPVPTGPQSVIVTVTYAGSSSVPAEARSLAVPININ